MPEFKVNIGNKDGRCYNKVIHSDVFLNKKIKEIIRGEDIGFKGYEFVVTGGSDKDGFPMRFDYNAAGRKKAFLSKGPCVKIRREGMRKRKTVRGNVISEVISQINLKVVKEGEKKLADIFGKKEEAKKEETKNKIIETKKETVKEVSKEKPKEEKVQEKK